MPSASAESPRTGTMPNPDRERDAGFNPASVLATPEDAPCLDTLDMGRLENAFRTWCEVPARRGLGLSRKRIFGVFLIIRYTGARLGEALNLNLDTDLLHEEGALVLGAHEKRAQSALRHVPLHPTLVRELQELRETGFSFDCTERKLYVDPGHVRRKFYERAAGCGFSPEMGSPNAIRRARAVELLREGMPLPVVQRLLGQSSPNLAASYVAMSGTDVRLVARHYMEKEARHQTSARNTFFGRVTGIEKGDIQSRIETTTLGGFVLVTVITNTSLERLGLREGMFCTAEVKAPWVMLSTGKDRPSVTADNRFPGKVRRVALGALTAECVIVLEDGTEICSVMTSRSAGHLALKEGMTVWASFNAFQTVLNVERP